jgi:hypothetical protein
MNTASERVRGNEPRIAREFRVRAWLGLARGHDDGIGGSRPKHDTGRGSGDLGSRTGV